MRISEEIPDIQVNATQYMAVKEISVSVFVGKLETLFTCLFVGLSSLNKPW